jgi:hypothetical protein
MTITAREVLFGLAGAAALWLLLRRRRAGDVVADLVVAGDGPDVQIDDGPEMEGIAAGEPCCGGCAAGQGCEGEKGPSSSIPLGPLPLRIPIWSRPPPWKPPARSQVIMTAPGPKARADGIRAALSRTGAVLYAGGAR